VKAFPAFQDMTVVEGQRQSLIHISQSATDAIIIYFFYSYLLFQKSSIPYPRYPDPVWFPFTASFPYS
jgi:hypothetical protein